jgi:peptidyl-prolyl cis-trans isomerase D
MWNDFFKRVQTFFVVLLIGLLSLVMGVIGFSGPTLDGCRNTGPTFAAQVYGHTITIGDFEAAYRLTGFDRYPPEQASTLRLRELTLDGLIERTLLVREAERLGFTTTDEEVMRDVAENEEVRLAGPVGAPPGYPSGALPASFRDRSGNFSTDNLRRFIQYRLRRSVEEFTEWQTEEVLAEQVRETVASTVMVSPTEIHDAYVAETERARISYVRFRPAHYRNEVEATDEAIGAWMEEHADEVDEEYRRNRFRYTDLEPQVRARHILIEAPENASEEERAEARARAEGLLGRALAGEDFGALAREFSDDAGSAARDGDLGWNPRGRMVRPFDEAQFALEEDGQITESLVESRFGFHIIQRLGAREGDVPEEEAKRELADDLYRTARAGELAREEAARALAYLRDGHSTAELDERLRDGWEEEADAPEEAPDSDEGDAAQDDGELFEVEAEEREDERGALAPRVEESRSFGRSDRAIRGAFDSSPVTEAAFETLSLDEPLPEEPLQLGDDWVIFQLLERTEASEEGFDDATQRRLRERLLRDKRAEVIAAYVNGLRRQASDDGAIRLNPSVLSYGATSEDEDEAEGEEEQASL